MRFRDAVVAAVLLGTLTLAARAEIRLPHVLSDHAVLQRDRPIHLWGWATPGAVIHAGFRNHSAVGQADRIGKWSLYLPPEAAGGPYDLTLSGDGPEVQLHDILVGDVWIASGQSNMEMPLAGFPGSAVVKDADKEIAAADNPRVRLLLVEHATADVPRNDINAGWTQCTPATARSFSAVAYFFGRELAAREHVPIGLVDSTWGGTPADSWVSAEAMGSNPQLLPAFSSRAAFADAQTDLAEINAAQKREDDADRAAGRTPAHHPWHPDQRSWLPSALYNGMIAPLTPLEIKGFIWYQGETNSAHDRAPSYGSLFSALIYDWRSHFAQGNLPFLFVQISSFSSPGEDWGMVREQQRRTLAVANTAMAVTLDVGLPENVHPPDKQTVAARLARSARALAYNEAVVYSGPSFRQATPQTLAGNISAMRVWFDHGNGLALRGAAPSSFELAGPDHHFLPADARVDGETVIVQSTAVPHPAYVRFGWAGVVTQFLYNAEGLPASTFTSERNPPPSPPAEPLP